MALWFWRESIDDDDLRPRVAAFRKKVERLFCIVRHKRNFVAMSGDYGDWECVRCPARGIDRLV